MYKQIIDVVNMGIVIIDSKYNITEWNRWMEINGGIKKEEIVGNLLFNNFPHLSNPSFLRSCKSVLKFGNYVYFSQKLHNFLFPFKTTDFHGDTFDFMQQSCTMAPLRSEEDEIVGIVITVQNVTEAVYLERSLKLMTQQDSLTGIYNRRYLDRRLGEEFNRYKRSDRTFSVIMIDIDDFKKINDTYGHNVGDQVLKAMTTSCTGIMRNSDILARYGGEEFCAILPDTDKFGARIIAERLRVLVKNETIIIDDDTKVSITISLGIAEVNPLFDSFEKIMDNADTALYVSKKEGKDKVSIYQERS